MPAQDITTADPHAQLLSIQEKIAARTGGQTPNVTVSPIVPPPAVVTPQTKIAEPVKPIVKPEETAKPLPEDKVPQAVADDVVNQLNGGGAAPRLEGFDPKDKNLLGKPGEHPSDQPVIASPASGGAKQSSQDMIAAPPRQGGAPRNDNNVNPNSMLELMKADIFKLLGMGQITEAEKKKNLDEMEETIWQDFVETDLPEMLPQEQRERFLDLLKTSPSAEKVINFFGNPPTGGLPKDFEQKYLRKTLDFKAEIVKEQIETLLLANEGKDAQKVELLKVAKAAADQGSWKKVEELMEKYA
jgi:hypothetical protein